MRSGRQLEPSGPRRVEPSPLDARLSRRARQHRHHLRAIGDRSLAPLMRSPVREYFASGDGLNGSAPAPHAGIGRRRPERAGKFR